MKVLYVLSVRTRTFVILWCRPHAYSVIQFVFCLRSFSSFTHFNTEQFRALLVFACHRLYLQFSLHSFIFSSKILLSVWHLCKSGEKNDSTQIGCHSTPFRISLTIDFSPELFQIFSFFVLLHVMPNISTKISRTEKLTTMLTSRKARETYSNHFGVKVTPSFLPFSLLSLSKYKIYFFSLKWHNSHAFWRGNRERQ